MRMMQGPHLIPNAEASTNDALRQMRIRLAVRSGGLRDAMALSVKSIIKKAKSIRGKVKRLVKLQPKLKFYYGWFYKHCSIRPNRVLFESYHGKNISDSPLAVLAELVARGDARDYEIFYSTDNPKRDALFVKDNNLPVKLVDICSRRYVFVLATAKYLLNNSSFPVYFIRRPEQVYVQTWHGTPLKTLGKRMRLGMESMYNVQHNFIQASCITFPNDFTREVIMRDYNLEQLYTGKVAMVGYPRNSVFLRGEDDAIKKKYGLSGFKTFAYMPTWRGKSNHDVAIASYKERVEEYLARLDNELRDDEKLFVNFHSMVAASISLGNYKHIYPFPDTVANYDFLANIDVLITDYSSVFFDYALTRRPIILFAYDLDEYLADRGMYFPIDELPFSIAYDIDELIDIMHAGEFDKTTDSRMEFERQYLRYDSADNAQVVLDLLLEKPRPDIELIDYSDNSNREWRAFRPQQYRNAADLDSIFEEADAEQDIIVLNRTGFKSSYSAFIHDNWRDGFNFMFVTKTTPRTFVEEVMSRVSERTRLRLGERERLRVFGDLHITGERCDYCIIENGFSYSDGSANRIASSIDRVGNVLIINVGEHFGRLDKVFATRGRTIIWSRQCTSDEVKESQVRLDIKEFFESSLLTIKRNDRYIISVSFSHDDGSRSVGFLVEQSELNQAKKIEAAYLRPFVFSADELDSSSVSGEFSFEHTMVYLANDRKITITPYRSTTGKLSLYVTYAGESARAYCEARLRQIKISSHRMVDIRAKLPRGNYRIVDVVVRNRAETVEVAYSLPYNVDISGDEYLMHIRFDSWEYDFSGIYWDIVVLIDEGFGYLSSIFVKTTRFFAWRTRLLNIQCVLPQDEVLFPYSAKGSKLAFKHRGLTKCDTASHRVKEVAAFAVFALFHFYWKRKRMWLVYEKYCSLAQDNAYRFFEYCMDVRGEEAKKFVYYVIDKDSPDYANVSRYGSNVVDFMSFRHLLYVMVAKIYIASDSRAHLYQWRPKPSIVQRRISKHKILFLQHGVTALKRVDRLFGRHGSNPMTYFLTTSDREQEIVMQNFGYSAGRAPILGFSRWDVLCNRANQEAPMILVMPTWRSWLEEQSDDVFLASEYFKTYSSLVRNASLLRDLHARGGVMKFFIHPKLSEYLRNFVGEDSAVEFVDASEVPLSDLIMECSLLITDYSSVCWDVLYLEKPVVFYQFDQERYKADIGTYIDFETELPGALCHTEEECVEAIRAYHANGYRLTERDTRRASAFFPVRDKNNRERTYAFLIGRGY